MTNPALFIVAGPNGAGKSLFSKELTATELDVFDGDKHMSALVKSIRKQVAKPFGLISTIIYLYRKRKRR
jgi:predicted ABC-type ATPase